MIDEAPRSHAIEFHDSTLLAIHERGRDIWLDLDAYVHQRERIEGACVLVCSGAALRIERLGTARYIENLPPDMNPFTP